MTRQAGLLSALACALYAYSDDSPFAAILPASVTWDPASKSLTPDSFMLEKCCAVLTSGMQHSIERRQSNF